MAANLKYQSAKDTPLYRKTFQLLEIVEQAMNGMQKDRKHTIGQW